MSNRTQFRIKLAALNALLALMLLANAHLASRADAALSGCRKDPIVWLSDGSRIQMSAVIGTSDENVQSVVYTLRAPRGTTITQIVYTGGALASSKESVKFYASLAPGIYTTDTVVSTSGPAVNVVAMTSMGAVSGSATGQSGDHLVVSLEQ